MKKTTRLLFGLVIWLLALIYVTPLYLVVANSLKTYEQVTLDTAGLPNPVMFSNFATVWDQIGYGHAFKNTFIITAGSIAGIIIICSMGAYMLRRRFRSLSRIIYFAIVIMMIVPFQAQMIPLVKTASKFHLTNSLPGEILIYIGCGIPFALFLYNGFLENFPTELEEAAMIDGCGTYGVFFRIVFPLLKPITTTIAILDMMWIWNDFLLPLITMSNVGKRTLTLSYYFYFGEYVNQWHLALAALLMSIIPAIIFYFFGQKYIVEGVAAGAVKG